MRENIQLIIFETKSLPHGYKALEEMTTLGLEPLEFYPHAQGVRILLKAPSAFSSPLPRGAETVSVSMQILKALLSQTGNTLKKHLVVVETKKLSELLKLAVEFEKIEADILEVRSLRSNHEKNYGLFTLEQKDTAASLLKNIEHSFLNSADTKLKEFLGFI